MGPKLPMRIDPQAAAILNSSCRAVEAILAKRARLDNEGQADMPLFVHMGELHDRPSHMLHHVSVIKGLLDARQKIAVASELPYDYLAKEYCAYAGTPPKPEVMNGLYLRDMSGESVRKYIFSSGHSSADYATNLLQDYLLRNNIPSRLTDSPRLPVDGITAYQFIDPSDGCNQRSMEACEKDPADLYAAVSKAGVYIRNRHMLVHNADLAAKSGARIILQQCGQLHVAGNSEKYPIEQSLAGQFQKYKLPTLSLLLNGNFRADIPTEQQFKEQGHDVLITYDLPDEGFPYAPGQKLSAEEIKYTDRLLAGAGLATEFGSNADIEKRRQRCLAETNALFGEWDKEFGLASAALKGKLDEKEKARAVAANAVFHLLTGPGMKR